MRRLSEIEEPLTAAIKLRHYLGVERLGGRAPGSGATALILRIFCRLERARFSAPK
jgi:hypothetical protein